MSISSILPSPPNTYYNIIIEPQVSKYSGQLITIPLLRRLGYQKYTFAAKWKQSVLPLLEFDYVFAQKQLNLDQLVCITNQAIEKNIFSIKNIVHQVNSSRIKDCVFVVDTGDFVIRDWCRPLVDLGHIQRKHSDLLKEYAIRFFGRDNGLLLSDTRNLFFQEMAFVYFITEEDKIKKTEDLFIFDQRTCFLPTWDILIRLARIDTTFGQIKYGMSFWIEKEKTLSKICDRLWDTLEQFNREKSEIEKMRKRFLEKTKMKDHAKKSAQGRELIKWKEWSVLKI